ncbi:MAG: hypothetical protein AAFX06_26435 [Planctomycetota bacterium]
MSSSSANEMIPAEDAVSIAKLLGEIAGSDADVPSRKRLLMEGLVSLTDADGWLWSVTYSDHDKGQPMSLGVIHDGLTDEQFSGWVEASQVARPAPPEDGPITVALAEGEHFTRTRDQLVSDDEWYSHPTVKKYRLDRGIDDFLYSIFPLEGGQMCSAIGLYKNVGRERFTARSRRIAHIVLSNVPWLHFADVPKNESVSVPQLTPAQRIVLVYLLEGRRRSEIAKLLKIADTTAKDHTRAVLRHFDVPDQLALVCKFRAGNGADL